MVFATKILCHVLTQPFTDTKIWLQKIFLQIVLAITDSICAYEYNKSSNINYNSFYFFRLFWVPLARAQSIDALYDLWHNWPQQTAEDGNPSRSRGEFVISFYDNKTINVKIELCEMKHEEEMKGTFTRRHPWFTTKQSSPSHYMWINSRALSINHKNREYLWLEYLITSQLDQFFVY